MSEHFFVQAGYPQATNAHDEDDQDLSDAIQTVFPLNTEDALLAWNCVYLRLGYKYDIAVMIEDLMTIIEGLLHDEVGSLQIHWTSNTFPAVWNVNWTGGIVTIHSIWHSSLGGLETLLKARPQVELPIIDFISEWKLPFVIVEQGLKAAGYTTVQIPQIKRLEELLKQMPRFGSLYENLCQSSGDARFQTYRRIDENQ